MAKDTTETKKTFKPGPYICIVQDGFAFFNKRSYSYGDRIVLEDEDMVLKATSFGERFIPESDFMKADGDIVRKVVSATRNNKTVEDVVRISEEEKKKIKAAYEAEIAKLKAQLEAKEADDNK